MNTLLNSLISWWLADWQLHIWHALVFCFGGFFGLYFSLQIYLAMYSKFCKLASSLWIKNHLKNKKNKKQLLIVPLMSTVLRAKSLFVFQILLFHFFPTPFSYFSQLYYFFLKALFHWFCVFCKFSYAFISALTFIVFFVCLHTFRVHVCMCNVCVHCFLTTFLS